MQTAQHNLARYRSRWGIALAAGAVFLLSARAGAGLSSGPVPDAMRHVVQAGDTIWALAADLDNNRWDRREIVWVIQEVNQLHGRRIQPGETLLLPANEVSLRTARRDPVGFARRATVRPPALQPPLARAAE